MQIVEKRLNEIKPYENNPRKNDNAVPYVAESIKRYGFKVPIVIQKMLAKWLLQEQAYLTQHCAKQCIYGLLKKMI